MMGVGASAPAVAKFASLLLGQAGVFLSVNTLTFGYPNEPRTAVLSDLVHLPHRMADRRVAGVVCCLSTSRPGEPRGWTDLVAQAEVSLPKAVQTEADPFDRFEFREHVIDGRRQILGPRFVPGAHDQGGNLHGRYWRGPATENLQDEVLQRALPSACATLTALLPDG